jgi:hypothetical protein
MTMAFKGSPVLFYDVGVWGKLGFGVPNWGKRMTSANMVILELVEVLGRNVQAMMLHPDALTRSPPSINTIIDIHKLVLRARSLLATEQVVDNQLRMEPTHAQPDKQSFLVFPTPIFMVRNRWMKTYCYYVMNALSEAMQSTENDNGFEITQVFAGIVGQPIVRLYKRMAVELLQISPTDASVPKDAQGNPNWYAFTLSQQQIMAYAPSTWFTPTELIDTVSPIDDIPSAYDLEPLTNGIPIPELPALNPYPFVVSDSEADTAADPATLQPAGAGATTTGPGGNTTTAGTSTSSFTQPPGQTMPAAAAAPAAPKS